ncbi:MAG TPA: Lrp/AsnC ligand binding domain-containing protein, partial [Kutzneria sp.]|nr:Lrp/AsnC ligand binding domain-containing protein [Kutzneria sp.]
QGDLHVRMVARSNDDLQRVVDEVVAVPGVQRTSTAIALSTPIEPRVRPLLRRVANEQKP